MKNITTFLQHLSINTKVILAYIGFVAVIGGAGSFLVVHNEQAVVQQEHIRLAQNVAENVSPMLVIRHRMMLNRLASIVGSLSDVRDCAIVNQEGIALAHTNMKLVGSEIPVGPAAHKAYQEKGYYFFKLEEQDIEGVYTPVNEAGRYLGSIVITFDRTDLLGMLQNPRETTVRNILNVLLFVALFGLIGAFVITRLISYPIRVLTAKTYNVLRGNFPEKKMPINYVHCWEKLNCSHTDCPSYMNEDEKCWTVAGTFCRGEVQGVFAQKIGDCRKCVVYKKNSGDELERLNDGFDIMVRNLVDNAESMKEDKEKIEEYAVGLGQANLENMEMRVYHEKILDSLSSAVISLDENLIIRKYNRAAQTILGADLKELLGKEITEVQKKCTRCNEFFGLILQAIERYQKAGSPVMGHEVSVRKLTGGTMTISLSVLPLFGGVNQAESPVIVAFEDITDREKMREELNLSRNLAALGEVAAKVAHDVRNPLNAIEGGIHYLITRYEEDPEIQNISNLIRGQVTRLNSVTQDLLKVSKPVLPNFTECDLNTLVEESVSFLQEEIRSGGITLETELSPECPAYVSIATSCSGPSSIWWKMPSRRPPPGDG